MKLVKATVVMPDSIAEKLSSRKLDNLCDNIQEYIEESIVDLACVHWDKELKVSFE